MLRSKELTLRFVLATVFGLAALSSSAQEQKIGLYHGLNTASVTGDARPRLGYHGGIQYNYKVKSFYLGAELAYIQRGYEVVTRAYDSSLNLQDVSIQYKYDYLALPLRGAYRWGNRFFGSAGLAFIPAFLVSSNIYWDGERLDPNPNGGPSKFDFGSQVELGFGYNVSERWAFMAKLAYYHSITTLSNANYFSTTSLRNRGTSLGMSFEYRIK